MVLIKVALLDQTLGGTPGDVSSAETDTEMPLGVLAYEQNREGEHMDLYEYQAKELFAAHGVPAPAGRVARTVDEAVAAAEDLGTR